MVEMGCCSQCDIHSFKIAFLTSAQLTFRPDNSFAEGVDLNTIEPLATFLLFSHLVKITTASLPTFYNEKKKKKTPEIAKCPLGSKFTVICEVLSLLLLFSN